MFARHCGEAVVHEPHEYTMQWEKAPKPVVYRCPGYASTYRR